MEINSNASNANIIYIENNNENNNENSDITSPNDNHISTTNSNCVRYKMHLSEGVGWIGSVLVLIPYVVTMNKTIDFVLNTLGASGLFIVCVTSKQYQSVIINAAWIVGGIYKYFS